MNRRRSVIVGALIAVVGLVVVGIACHRPLLMLAAGLLVVDDRPAHADAIVVLAGATPEREAKAATLYREGWAPRVVISRQVLPTNVRDLLRLGVRSLDLQQEARLALEKYGVPANRIVALADVASNTESELALVHRIARERGYRRVILVSSPFHTRRVKLIWSRADGERIEGLVVAARNEEFTVDGWWRKRRVAEAALHEYLGLLAIYLGLSHLLH